MCLKLEKVWKKGKAESKSSPGLFGFSFKWYAHQDKLAGNDYPLETLSVSTEVVTIYNQIIHTEMTQHSDTFWHHCRQSIAQPPGEAICNLLESHNLQNFICLETGVEDGIQQAYLTLTTASIQE